jgi:hypothetical protein
VITPGALLEDQQLCSRCHSKSRHWRNRATKFGGARRRASFYHNAEAWALKASSPDSADRRETRDVAVMVFAGLLNGQLPLRSHLPVPLQGNFRGGRAVPREPLFITA